MKKAILTLTLIGLLLIPTHTYATTTTTTTTTSSTSSTTGSTIYYLVTYDDLPEDHWACDAVYKMSGEGILSGYPDGTFRPNSTVTYAEFITMATTMTNAIGSNTTADDGDHWATKFYECGLNCGYYTQYDITAAQLDQPITRGDMALIIASLMRADVTVSNYGDYDVIMEKIKDVDATTEYDTSIIKSYATGALSGYPDGTFQPNGYLTRAEAASAIYRTEDLADRTTYAVPEGEEDTTAADASTVDIDSVKYSEAEYILTIRENYDYTQPLTATQQADILTALKLKYSEANAKAFLEAAVTFSSRTLPDGKGETRKQYAGNYPVLIRHTVYAFTIHIYPTTMANDEYWDTLPGEINDFYF